MGQSNQIKTRLLRLVTLFSLNYLVLNPWPVSGLNSVLDINGTFPYLINKTDNSIIEPRNYMDFDNLYNPNETYRMHQSAQGRNYHLIKAFDFANYYQSDYWHYSSELDLKLSAYPIANDEKCAKHLNWLESQLNSSTELFKGGNEHINLMTLVDSFGRPESNTFLGHAYWLGSYYECKRVTIDLEQFERERNCSRSEELCSLGRQALKTMKPTNSKRSRQQQHQQILKSRYCIGKARDSDWPTEREDNYVPRVSYKVGLCLPESCETLSFAKYRNQIERLMRFNLPEYMKARIFLADMYCLPDERSPIRALSTQAQVFISLNAVWLLTLLVATIVYSLHERGKKDFRSIIKDDCGLEKVSTRAASNDAVGVADAIVESEPDSRMTLSDEKPTFFEQDMLRKNCDLKERDSFPVEKAAIEHKKSQFSKLLSNAAIIKRPEVSLGGQINQLSRQGSSSSCETQDSQTKQAMMMKIFQCLSIKENLKEFQEPPALLKQPGASKRLRINLNALDSIKCLCCILVIFSHIIFIHMQHLSNIVHTIDLSFDVYPRVLIAFFNFVDTFFIISSMLTTYFIFKRFNKRTFQNPLIWLFISLSRLLRLSPIYILVLWFTKTLTVYLNDGPIWDYGTDKNSIRGLCINDAWWKSILYLGNLNSMQPICILPAWSIIVDSQYSLIIPPMLFLLLKHKRLAYLTLILATIVSTAKMSIQLANQTAVRPNDMAKVRLHVYPLISRFAAEFYNTAWNRIGPVAIGIAGGHMLYLYDIKKIKHWPWFMRDLTFKIILLLHLLIFILPTMSKYTSEDAESDSSSTIDNSDTTIFLISNAAIKPIWSLINTIFLLRLITDLRKHSVCARLASHNIWHCMGKLCFASYLIHYEIILFLLKSRQDGLVDPNWSNAGREFSLVFLISTFTAYLIYILYEAPINKLITLLLTNPAYCKRNLMTKNHAQINDEESLEQQTVIINRGAKFPKQMEAVKIKRSLKERFLANEGQKRYVNADKGQNADGQQSAYQNLIASVPNGLYLNNSLSQQQQ